MSPLLGPIFAQLVTLAVSDRTEARYVRSDTAYTEAGTYPRAGLNFGWRHTTLTFGYGPSFTVTPLGSEDRKLLVSQNVAGSAAYRYAWQHTILTVGEFVGYSEVNFREQALAGPVGAPVAVAPGGGPPVGMTAPIPAGGTTGGLPGAQPGPGTAVPVGSQTPATNTSIKTLTSSTNIGINNAVSAVLLVGGSLAYSVTRTVNDDRTLPLVRGPSAEAHATYRLTPFDSLTSSLTTQYAATSDDNNAWLAVASETWTHAFSLRTTTRLGGGLSITRNSLNTGLVFWSIYPTFNASINHTVPAGRSAFAFSLAATSAPVIDPILGSVDPRFSVNGGAGWGWGRFSSGLSAGSAVSVSQQNDNGAFNSIYGSFNTGYRLGASLSVDAGARGFWQGSEGRRAGVPASLAGYVGVTFGSLAALTRGH